MIDIIASIHGDVISSERKVRRGAMNVKLVTEEPASKK
jgi:hypothetical protein